MITFNLWQDDGQGGQEREKVFLWEMLPPPVFTWEEIDNLPDSSESSKDDVDDD